MKISSLEIFFFDQFCTIFLTMSVAEKSGSVRLDFRFFLGGWIFGSGIRRYLPARNLEGQRVQNRISAAVSWEGGGDQYQPVVCTHAADTQGSKDRSFLPTIQLPLDDPVSTWRSLNKAGIDRQLLFPVPCPSSVSSQVKRINRWCCILIENFIRLFVCFFLVFEHFSGLCEYFYVTVFLLNANSDVTTCENWKRYVPYLGAHCAVRIVDLDLVTTQLLPNSVSYCSHTGCGHASWLPGMQHFPALLLWEQQPALHPPIHRPSPPRLGAGGPQHCPQGKSSGGQF